MRVDELDHVALRVSDLARSVAWYQDVLGLEREHIEAWGDYPVVLKAGHASLALFPAPDASAAPAPPDGLGMLHVAFRVDAAAFAAAQQELEARGLEPEFQDHDIARSLYLRDPDGYLVEITTYQRD